MIYILFDYKDGYNIASKLAPPKCSMVQQPLEILKFLQGVARIFDQHSTVEFTPIERESYIKIKATITQYEMAITLEEILQWLRLRNEDRLSS